MTNKKIFSKGQTTIELLMVLSISLVIMVIVYAMYAEQVQTNNETSDFFLAKSAVQKIVNASNTVYLSGIGSRTKIEIEFPSSVDLENSVISSNVILLKMFNGNDIIGITDINLEGVIRNQNGKQVIYLFFDGDNVKLQYLDFELNQYSISFSTIPGTSRSESISIRNNYFEQATFFITKNFSHSNVSLDLDDDPITIPSGSIETIDLDFIVSDFASGNYSGNIVINGEINDVNISKTVSIGVEVLLSIEELMIYPLETSFESSINSNVEKTFSICNKSLIDFDDLSWSVNGYSDGNIFEWISNLEDLTDINQIDSGSCEEATLTFNIPDIISKDYNGSISVNYTDSQNNPASYSALILIEVLSESFFFSSVILQNLEANYFLSNFVKKSDNNYWFTIGELDWNDLARNDSINSMVDGEINFTGSELSESNDLFDSNLIGLWHLNNNALDSSDNSNDGSWSGTESYAVGLWDTNAGNFGNSNYVDLGDLDVVSENATFIAWVKADSISATKHETVLAKFSTYFNYFLQLRTNLILFAIKNAGGQNSALFSETTEIGEWIQVGGLWNENSVCAIKNGRVSGCVDRTIDLYNNDVSAKIGRDDGYSGTIEYFDGQIEEVSIWNRALSEQEILDLYESQSGEFHEPSIVGLWHLNDDALDSSYNSNNGSWSGTESYDVGLFGTNAGSFNGSTDYVSVDSTDLKFESGAQDFSVSVWVKPNSVNSRRILTLKDADNDGWRLLEVGGVVWCSVDAIDVKSSSVLKLGVWQNVVCTIDRSGNGQIYINGVADGSPVAINGEAMSISESLLRIGTSTINFASTSFFDGLIEEVIIWNRDLSSNEVKELYEKQKGDWLDTNLVAYYKFNESSGTTIFDSARNFDGTLVSTANINAQGLWDSNALSLNGSSDYVDLGKSSSINLVNKMSISFWTYFDTISSGSFISRRSPTSNEWQIAIQTSTSKPYVILWGTSDVVLYANTVLNTSQWYHIAVTYDKDAGENNYKIYVNGLLDGQKTVTGAITLGDTSTKIGTDTYNYFNGLIDEVKIYDKVLTPEEILADYNSFLESEFVDNNILDVGKSREWDKIKINSDFNYSFGNELDSSNDLFDENLVGLWQFNDKNSQGWILNSATNNRDGQLYNGADVNAYGLWDTNSLFCDGINDYANIGVLGNTTNGDMTFSAWIFKNETGVRDIILGNYSHSNNINFEITASNYVRIWWNNGERDLYGTYAIPSNAWVLVTIVRDIIEDKFYMHVNGELKNTFDGVGTNVISTVAHYVCKDARDGTTAFNGSIEEVMIFDRALSEEEIKEYFEKSSRKIDLNLYSCSDTLCENKTSTQQISNAKNNFDYDLTLNNSRYFGWSAYFKSVTGLESLVLQRAVAKPFLQDINISIIQ